ncbi:Hypothetical predicted protein [Marmota monax]|uniref:Uncharacterized protein n=1 Tax=Marmota monax TaxID=9995 RepID=A0A5E4BQD7_MARMO|nr:hypothetical protein GHT09_012282 [Marmota monax]VTJ71280.1 Hypothetical predicted protein [Marmota monax]
MCAEKRAHSVLATPHPAPKPCLRTAPPPPRAPGPLPGRPGKYRARQAEPGSPQSSPEGGAREGARGAGGAGRGRAAGPTAPPPRVPARPPVARAAAAAEALAPRPRRAPAEQRTQVSGPAGRRPTPPPRSPARIPRPRPRRCRVS